MKTLDKKIGRAEFITRLADKGYTKKDSVVILADVLAVISEAIGNGECVSLPGFGRFTIRRMKPKVIMNVSTGVRDTVPPRNYIRFTPGQSLKAAAASAELEG